MTSTGQMMTTLSKTDKKDIATAEKIVAAENPLELIVKAKIDLVQLMVNLNRIALTAELIAKDRDGFPVSLGHDNRAQMLASGMILEIAKVMKDKSTATNVAIFNVDEIANNAQRVLALRNKA